MFAIVWISTLLLTHLTAAQTLPYLNPDLPIEERVDDLVGRMTLEEKVSQMSDVAPAIERLGVPEHNWWNEALHGVARAGVATVFPQAIGLGATWNPDLIYDVATAISDEARAKHHRFAESGRRERYQGLTHFSPNINLFRDPRWGRGQETYGEDPHLTGRLGVSFIQGLQGDDPNYLKTVATVKHFAVHSGPEPERHVFDAIVDERAFREYYLPHFEVGIREGGANSLMCAYNSVDGIPACASRHLLEEILRQEWGFDGYVVSDCWALNDFYANHKMVDGAVEAAAVGVRAGTDLDCGSMVYPKLTEAVEKDLITEAAIDKAVKRLFTARFRLGIFDPAESVPYAQIPYEVVDSEVHRELTGRTARESIVLLKNDGVLPLRKDLGRVAVIGPNADDWLMLIGNYNGLPAEPTTPLEGIRRAVSAETEVVHATGSAIVEGIPAFAQVPGAVFRTPDGDPGLRLEYFPDHEITGDPVHATTVSAIDFTWQEIPDAMGLRHDDLGLRWTGHIIPEESGDYQFGIVSSSGFSVYLEDSLLVRSRYQYINELGDPRVIQAPSVRLEAGQSYRIRMEASDTYGDAVVQLWWAPPGDSMLADAIDAAEEADAIVLFLGLTPAVEGEEMPVDAEGFRGGDRTDIALPAAQQELLERVVEIGKPTVLVLMSGSAIAVNWADENVGAILEAWYPGQSAGDAIADVLFGDYNPAGRLPVTFYRSTDALPALEDYSLRGRTYLYADANVLYPFGHGLSYTRFEYSNLRMDEDVLAEDGRLSVSFDVTNAGSLAGDEVTQLYVSYPESSIPRPMKQLAGFSRIHLQPGDIKTISLTLDASDLAYWDAENDRWEMEHLPVTLMVGASSGDIRLRQSVQVIE